MTPPPPPPFFCLCHLPLPVLALAFRHDSPPVINSQVMLKSKLDMVEQLGDIELATNLLKQNDALLQVNPIDANYNSLRTQLVPLEVRGLLAALASPMLDGMHRPDHFFPRLRTIRTNSR